MRDSNPVYFVLLLTVSNAKLQSIREIYTSMCRGTLFIDEDHVYLSIEGQGGHETKQNQTK